MEFDWDDANVEHLALHGVTPEEVEEVFGGSYVTRRAKTVRGEKREVAYGITEAGGYLTVFFTIRKGRLRPITAYMTDRKKRK